MSLADLALEARRALRLVPSLEPLGGDQDRLGGLLGDGRAALDAPRPVDFLSTVLKAARSVPSQSTPAWSKKLSSSEAMKACTSRLGMRS